MFISKIRVCILICCSFLVSVRTQPSNQEPVCTSRFDFEHKMLTKIVMLEIEQTKLKETIATQTELIKTLQDKSEEHKTNVRAQLSKTISRLNNIEDLISLAGTGSTYIRWGRTDCPSNGTERVYEGYAAGAHYTNSGTASDYICLPTEPLWNHYEDEVQSGATVYGAEYELDHRNRENFFGKDLRESDVPCAVCNTKRSSIMMIPGRNACYDGWTLEYEGYLVAGYESHASSSEFVCLDIRPEALTGGVTNENGKLFYFAEARCGSLRCPPYVNGRELTCAVCSK